MDVPTFIQNHAAVVDFFGCWPSFHDAQVISYEPAPDSVKLTIHGWLMTDEVDAKGYFVLRNHALVTFRFSDLHDVQMDAFKANILSILEISQGCRPSVLSR